MSATCPRCGETFGCGAGEEAPCWCVSVALEEATRADLRERYAGCLCPRCLVAVATAGATPA